MVYLFILVSHTPHIKKIYYTFRLTLKTTDFALDFLLRCWRSTARDRFHLQSGSVFIFFKSNFLKHLCFLLGCSNMCFQSILLALWLCWTFFQNQVQYWTLASQVKTASTHYQELHTENEWSQSRVRKSPANVVSLGFFFCFVARNGFGWSFCYCIATCFKTCNLVMFRTCVES